MLENSRGKLFNSKRRYDEELARGKSLDGKASNLIGYVSIVTGLRVGLGAFSNLEKLAAPEYYIPYLLGVSALLGSIIASFRSQDNPIRI